MVSSSIILIESSSMKVAFENFVGKYDPRYWIPTNVQNQLNQLNDISQYNKVGWIGISHGDLGRRNSIVNFDTIYFIDCKNKEETNDNSEDIRSI